MNDRNIVKLGRRDLLKWTTPAIASVYLPAHAAMSPPESIAITKEQVGGPNPATAVDDVIEYRITITNDGGMDISDIIVTDTQPNGETITLTDPIESGTQDGILSVGESWEYNTTYTVTGDDLNSGDPLMNVASAESSQFSLSVTASVETSTVALCGCEGPPVVSLVAPPECAGDPPTGTAQIEISAPGDCDMEIKAITVTTTDDKSTITDLPMLPAVLSPGAPLTLVWSGPATDSLSCLPEAQIDISIDYCCEDQVILTEAFDITDLLVDSVLTGRQRRNIKESRVRALA